MKTWFWLVLGAATLLPVAQQVRADTAEEFYRGKQIKFIVSFDTGTDYDQWTRLIVRHLGKHLDGHPSFVVQNMGAAGGILATNHLFNVAASDGTVIGMIGRNMPYFALVQEANARYDPVKFNWIGSPELTNRVCTAYERSPVQKARGLVRAGAAHRRRRRGFGREHDTGAALQPSRHEVQAGRRLSDAAAGLAGDGARRGRRPVPDGDLDPRRAGRAGSNPAS